MSVLDHHNHGFPEHRRYRARVFLLIDELLLAPTQRSQLIGATYRRTPFTRSSPSDWRRAGP